MTEFLKSNAALDKIVTDATLGTNAGFEAMREALKSELARTGQIVRGDGGGYGAQLVPGAEPEPTPVMSETVVRPDYQCERVLYPSGNVRIVITGPTEQNLDDQERWIRGQR
jgi:hypothetical protein